MECRSDKLAVKAAITVLDSINYEVGDRILLRVQAVAEENGNSVIIANDEKKRSLDTTIGQKAAVTSVSMQPRLPSAHRVTDSGFQTQEGLEEMLKYLRENDEFLIGKAVLDLLCENRIKCGTDIINKIRRIYN
ncbi:hypothetical protein HK099_004615 [Clydaea vesicula]|uniref:Uncharacterized protein n=1 Tax=Clydaea vesicula TaxID=447962 RepID=A0AAD5Y064_9FUNG|nr:hypothetical protein HK099_004615 [Clydaea vesicula]